MGELGFMGMMVSPEYGGGGMDTVSYVLAMEEISKIDASASVVMSVNTIGMLGSRNLEMKNKTKIPKATCYWRNYWCFLFI